MKRERTLGVILGILFYLFWGILYFYLYIFEAIAGSISDFSTTIFYILYLIIPIIILIMPLIFKFVFKKKFYKSICYSALIIAIHIVILLLLTFGIRNYFKTFTTEKWTNNNWQDFRYLMIEDLENKYNLIGMKKEEVYKILGKEDKTLKELNTDNSLCYSIRNGFLEGDYYIISLNDKGFVVNIKNVHWD